LKKMTRWKLTKLDRGRTKVMLPSTPQTVKRVDEAEKMARAEEMETRAVTRVERLTKGNPEFAGTDFEIDNFTLKSHFAFHAQSTLLHFRTPDSPLPCIAGSTTNRIFVLFSV
jgi:hypothetical protein